MEKMKFNYKQEISKAIDLINEHTKIHIVSHINPDGDSIGSMLSLTLALEKLGKKVCIIKNDNIPEDFIFLPGVEKIRSYEDIKSIDLLVTLDASDPGRLGEAESLISTSNKVINIDHHVSNTLFGNINVVNPNASATGELLFEFINELGVVIDKDIAINLYTAISTDTGSFLYSNVTSNTHTVVSELINRGIEISVINNNLYENISLNRVNLLVDAVKNMNSYFEGKLVVVKVTQKMLDYNNSNWEDTEGIVSFIRKIKGVEVACFLKEISANEVRISMRSKEYVDVASLCSNFGGGGHNRAAGCTIYNEINLAEKMIVSKIKEVLR